MSWPFETSTPHVTPEEFLAYVCRREGLTREQLALPPVMVSAPFKILLFVLVDGWNLVVGSLMKSFY